MQTHVGIFSSETVPLYSIILQCIFIGYQQALFFSLPKTERDVSVRQRAIDLLYAMCDHSNSETIVGELLTYLEKADYSIRETLVRWEGGRYGRREGGKERGNCSPTWRRPTTPLGRHWYVGEGGREGWRVGGREGEGELLTWRSLTTREIVVCICMSAVFYLMPPSPPPQVLKIAILSEKYAQDYSWYVDTILNLIRLAGDYVSEDVWYRIIQIVINRQDVQGYAAKTCFEVIMSISRYSV